MSLRPLSLSILLACLPLAAAPAETDSGNLNEIRRAIDQTQNDLQEKQQAKRKTQKTLDQTQTALSQAQKELAAITSKQKDTLQKLQKLQTELESLKAGIAGTKAQLARLLNGQYRNRQQNAVFLFLQNAEPGKKARYLEYARHINQANRQVIAELAQQQQRLRQQESQIDHELAQLEKIKMQKQAALGKLNKTKTAAQQESSKLDAEIGRQNRHLKKLQSDEARLNRILTDIARRSAEKRKREAAAGKQARPAEKNTPTDKNGLTAEDRALSAEYVPETRFGQMQGRLPRPVSGAAIGGRFGQTKPEGGIWRGLFFATPPTVVRSIADGTVDYAGRLEGFGNTVMINHGDGYISIYTGLSSISVGGGSHVSAGQDIGGSGSLPTGEQGLYFEIRYRLTPINPSAWLR